jgi:hypothetical protein
MAIVQAIYGLAGRQTQGFLQSIFELMKLDLTAPDHPTLSRRWRQLEVTLPVKDWSKSRRLARSEEDSARARQFEYAHGKFLL